jgi:hypothetical protein
MTHPVGAPCDGVGEEVAGASARRELAHGVPERLSCVLKLPLGSPQLKRLKNTKVIITVTTKGQAGDSSKDELALGICKTDMCSLMCPGKRLCTHHTLDRVQ